MGHPLFTSPMTAHGMCPAFLATLAGLQQLDAGMDHLLTLLVGPAGSGKSALLRAWLAARPWPAAWIALAPADNEPAHFGQRLALAADQIQPGSGQASPRLSSLDDCVAEWLNSLAAVDRPFVVVLDGYDVIQSPAVHPAVMLILDYPPPHLHLFITSRSEPPLQLPRLRVRRQLLSIAVPVSRDCS